MPFTRTLTGSLAAWFLSLGALSFVEAQDTQGQVTIAGLVIEAGSRLPIPAATVRVALSGPPSADGSSAPSSGAVTTDKDGRFQFSDLRPGSYTLEAQGQGYWSGGYLQQEPLVAPQVLRLFRGERKTVTLRLWKHAAITGTVRDEKNVGVIGATVHGLRWSTSGGRRCLLPRASVVSDDRGAYRLAGLPPGSYAVAVLMRQLTQKSGRVAASGVLSSDVAAQMRTAAGALPAGGYLLQSLGGPAPRPSANGGISIYSTIFYPSSSTASQAVEVPLKSGEDATGIDLRLEPGEGFAVSGRVSAVPETGLAVHLRDSSAEDFCARTGFESATAIVDPDGAFRLLGIRSGSYTLTALVTPRPVMPSRGSVLVTFIEGFPTRSVIEKPGDTPIPLPIPPGPTFWAAGEVAVTPSGLAGIELDVKPGLRLSGRTVFEGGSRPATEDLQRVLLTVEDVRGATTGRSSPAGEGRIAADGTFTTTAVPIGTYFLRASGLPANWSLQGVRHRGLDLSDTPFDVAEEISTIEIVFGLQTSQLTGHVVGASEVAATVVVFPVDGKLWTNYGINSRRIRRTDVIPGETYTFRGLPPGPYFVAAIELMDSSTWAERSLLSRLARSASRVEVRAASATSQDLKITR